MIYYGLFGTRTFPGDVTTMSQTVFMTVVNSERAKQNARALICSIRDFGGALRDCSILVFASNPQADCRELAADNVRVIPLIVPVGIRDYYFGAKVYACAQAEAMVAPGTRSLVCIDPLCVIINPPILFDLGSAFDAAVRPVHIRNVGLLATDPLDAFWERVYETVGVADITTTVESFVDAQCLRAYYNTHAFAINPAKGLLRRWLTYFELLVGDNDWQTRACPDVEHQLFLFQAILSALIVSSVEPHRIRVLPATYNYPYHLHQATPAERRAHSLSDLICLAYEDAALDPDTMSNIAIDEQLKVWLVRQFAR